MLLLNFTTVLSLMMLSSIHTFHLNYLYRSGFNIYSHHQYRAINGLNNKYIVIYPSCLYNKNDIISIDTMTDTSIERVIDDASIADLSTNNKTSINTYIINIIHNDDNNYIKIQKIINNTLTHQNFTSIHLHSIQFHNDRVEVILALSIHVNSANMHMHSIVDNSSSPSIDMLSSFHRAIYLEMEKDVSLDKLLTNYEVLVSSPGISNTLTTNRDFETFKGFSVIVHTNTIYRRKTQFEGTLVRRTENEVILSLKGRPVTIPRDIIDTVQLPESTYEDNDNEIKKFRK